MPISASDSTILNDALRSLPRRPEHFVSDIHGEAPAFEYLVRSCSGELRPYVRMACGGAPLSDDEDLPEPGCGCDHDHAGECDCAGGDARGEGCGCGGDSDLREGCLDPRVRGIRGRGLPARLLPRGVRRPRLWRGARRSPVVGRSLLRDRTRHSGPAGGQPILRRDRDAPLPGRGRRAGSACPLPLAVPAGPALPTHPAWPTRPVTTTLPCPTPCCCKLLDWESIGAWEAVDAAFERIVELGDGAYVLARVAGWARRLCTGRLPHGG